MWLAVDRCAGFLWWAASPSEVSAYLRRWWALRKTRKLVKAAIPLMPYKARQTSPNSWVLNGGFAVSRMVSLFVTVSPEGLELTAGSQLWVQPNTVPSWVLWKALRLNAVSDRCFLCVQPFGGSFQILTRTVWSLGTAGPRDIAESGRHLVAMLKVFIRELYAEVPRLYGGLYQGM